jgi:MoaA/NifB/PqqE/SkfB family radical SAM enzyme
MNLLNTIDVGPKETPTKMVVWDLGRRCNFDCSYCTGWMHSTTSPFQKLDRFKKTAAFIDGYYSIYEQFHKQKFRPVISFTGGEPAVNPDFFPLIEHLQEEYPHFVLNLTTNGTWSKRRGKFLIDNLDSITVSYHCEGNDKQRQLVRDNLIWTRENIPNKHKLKVNVMMHVDHWDDCIDLIDNVLIPNDIKYIPRTIGDDGRNRYEWFKDVDGEQRRTSHKYTVAQMDYIVNHWQKKNEKVGDTTTLKKSEDGDVRKIGRMCCGGRCMTTKSDDGKPAKDTMFIEQSDFKDWGCMVNWFFLHIEEDKDVAYHHQTCMAKSPDTPAVDIGPMLSHVKTFTNDRGPICNLSKSDEYLLWLENKVLEDGRPPTMICPNKHCGCGVCVPKAKNMEDFNMLKSKYIRD